MPETKQEKPQEPEYIKDQDLPDVIEQYRLGDNIRDENGNIIYNSDVIKYLQSIFGDGSDGDVDITGDTNLITDMFYDNLTIASPFTLYTSGYKVFVKNKLTINAGAKIARNGNAGGNGGNGVENAGGAGGIAGAALSSGSLYGALVGAVGGAGGVYTTVGSPGTDTDLAKCLGNNAVGGGNGGAGQTSAGGAGASGGDKTGTVYNSPRGLVPAYMLYDTLPSGDVIKSNPSAGSGGGGGGGAGGGAGHTAGGGGGGGSASSGGIVEIFAKNLINNGSIEAKGAKGGDGGNGFAHDGYPATNGGGGGGAAGANGGIIILVYISKTGSGSTDVSGGAKGLKGLKGGTAGADGNDGTAGASGKTFELKV